MKKIFINNLLIVLIFFLIFEILLRYFNLADLKGHGENFNEKQKNIETIIFGKKVFLNQYGYRVPSKEFLYKNKTKKIIFIGDSVLFGSGVNEQETFVGKFRSTKKDTTIVNAGIVGNDISNISNDIKKNHKIFEEAIFVVILTLDDINDTEILNNENKAKEIKNNFFQKLKKNYFFNKINSFLRSKSYTYLWIKGKITKPSERYFFESYKSYKKEKNINFFINKIDEINSYSNNKKIDILFVLIPYEYQVRKNCEEKLLLPQNKIKKILKEKKLKYFDFTKDFCNHPSPKELYLKFDPVHLSVIGHNFIYNTMGRIIN